MSEIYHSILNFLSKGPLFTGRILTPEHASWQWALGVAGDFLIIGAALFFLLNAYPARYRKALIVALTFLAGLLYSVEFFVPADPETGANFLTGAREQAGKATNVIYAFAIGLGIYSLLRFHGRNLVRRQPGWHNNLAFFIAFVVMMSAGFWKYLSPSLISENTFNMLFLGVVTALGATMFSTIGFYIVSAAYRAFRIRSGEATLMLSAAFIVMLGQVPVGAYFTGWLPEEGISSLLRFENLSYWILKQPNMAAWRGMAFGIEIGALAMALRTWLSLERGSFFDREL